jgi:hypothetical protein
MVTRFPHFCGNFAAKNKEHCGREFWAIFKAEQVYYKFSFRFIGMSVDQFRYWF